MTRTVVAGGNVTHLPGQPGDVNAAGATIDRPAPPRRSPRRLGGIGGNVLITALAPAAWGTTYLVTTELLPPGRPLLAGALRALPAGIVLAIATNQRPVGPWWAKSFVLGTLNIGGFFALLFFAAYRLPGGVAATLGAVQPLIAAGLAATLLRERLRANVVTAGLLGVIGVALLVLRAGAQLDPAGVAAGLAGATSMATGVVLTKRWGRPVPLLTFTAWQLVAGGLLLLPLALVVEGPPADLSGRNLLGYLWLASAGTGLAYTLWFRGIERLPVGQVSLLALLSPIVATTAGWVVLDQRLTGAQLAGATIVFAAMLLGQLPQGRTNADTGRQRRRARPAPAPRPHVGRPRELITVARCLTTIPGTEGKCVSGDEPRTAGGG